MKLGQLQWAFFWLAFFAGYQIPMLWLVWLYTLFFTDYQNKP